uniref:Crooked neck protein, putative n=1 Tax=Arundo donax TaxID=35708 RepID=A0A0A9I3N6_ARUDO
MPSSQRADSNTRRS